MQSCRKPGHSARPAIYLGDGASRSSGVGSHCRLAGWGYIQRAVGKDLIIAGHDHPARGETDNKRRPKTGTGSARPSRGRLRAAIHGRAVSVSGDCDTYNPVSAASKIDLAASPAIEFLPCPTIVVLADLDLEKTPVLRVNTAHPAGGGFYDLGTTGSPASTKSSAAIPGSACRRRNTSTPTRNISP